MAKTPPIVGAAETAQILGVVVTSVSRLRENGKLPPLAADLAATPVWYRKHIVDYAKTGKIPESVEQLDIVGTSEVAQIVGVDKSQIGRWRRAKKFPASWVDLAATPVWKRPDVLDFAQARTAAKV